MTSSSVRSDSLPAHGEMVAYIVASLCANIASGDLRPGERLVETELTERFSVSRGSVREALRLLAAEGLIVHAPNRGAEVRRLDRKEKRDLYQIVTELDVLGAGLAAVCSDTAKRAAFRSAIAPIYSDAPRSGADFTIENDAFHHAIFVLADNAQLLALTRRLAALLLLSISDAAVTPDRAEMATKEHRQIARAIIESDAERARASMREHLIRASAFAINQPE